MKRLLPTLLLALLLASAVEASTLPGFRVQVVQGVSGFLTALAADSHGTIYYSTKNGDVFRLGPAEIAAGKPTLAAHLPTEANGNCGLIGLALRDDRTAIVHYTTPALTYDIISSVDLTTGAEREIHRFVCDKDYALRGVSSEHHGGNLAVASDGSIFFAIGDFGNGFLAPDPAWNAGKVWHILADGTPVQFAKGFRNPFDLAWDESTKRVVMTDNGDAADDEIDVVAQGDDCGWPYTAGNGPAIAGTRAPVYTFPIVVAPTGLAPLRGRNPILRRGYLIGSFVTKALYYVPDVYAQPVPDPVALIQNESDPVIDVVEGADGRIYFASGFVIYRLITPMPGDCNGDGFVDSSDLTALSTELSYGPHPLSASRASFGCDANSDGMIDAHDAGALSGMMRVRAARR